MINPAIKYKLNKWKSKFNKIWPISTIYEENILYDCFIIENYFE
jgi:hypothetical protein